MDELREQLKNTMKHGLARDAGKCKAGHQSVKLDKLGEREPGAAYRDVEFFPESEHFVKLVEWLLTGDIGMLSCISTLVTNKVYADPELGPPTADDLGLTMLRNMEKAKGMPPHIVTAVMVAGQMVVYAKVHLPDHIRGLMDAAKTAIEGMLKEGEDNDAQKE